MLRAVAGALLCAACCYLGVAVKRVYRVRADFYADVSSFISLAVGEISYLKTPIVEILERFAPKCNPTAAVFTEIVAALRGNVRESIMQIRSVYLKQTELDEILNYFAGAGRGELKEELNHIKALEERVKVYEHTATEDSKRLGGLYFKLLVLLGVTLLLIVI